MATLEQINDHVRTYPDPNPATGSAWTTAERAVDIERIEAELAALAPVPDPVIIQASITRADAVNAAMENLKNTDKAIFEIARRETFEQQAARFGL